MAAAYICGVLLYFRPREIWAALLLMTGGSVVLVLAAHRKKKKASVMAVLAAVLFLTAFIRCGVQEQKYEKCLENAGSRTEMELTGIVFKKEIKTNSYLYYLKTSNFKNSEDFRENENIGKVLVYGSEDVASIGSEIEVSGQLEQFPHASNEGNFDLADYYKSQNITLRMFAEDIKIRKESGWNFREMLYQIQKRISQVYETELNDRDAGILGTLVLGNQAMMEDEIEELYQGAGISHILAISGLHISILGYGLFRFLRKCRCSYWSAAGVSGGAVFAFALMSGMAVSARRALIMYLLMMGAQVMGKTYDAVNALALAALIILTVNPQALFQSGFQFSFLSLAALCISSAVLSGRKEEAARRLQEENRKFPTVSGKADGLRGRIRKRWGAFLESVMSGAILQLFLVPLTAWHYYEVPLYALFLNLLVIPLCGWLLGFGLLGGVTGIFFPELSKWLLIVCHMILAVYEKAIGAVNALPFSQVVTGRPESWILLIYYVFLTGICLSVICGKPSLFFSRKLYHKAAMLVHGYAGLLLPALFLGALLFLPERQVCRVDFLDVSQGDGIYLTDGHGTHLMIDGGSTDEKQVGKYRIRPFLKYNRVKKIDVWIITHGDEDHYSGALELMQSGYPVDYLVLAGAMPDDDSRQTLEAAARQNHTEVVRVSAGDSLDLEGCIMRCLYPDEEETGNDVNALSQVWSLEKDGLSVLFTGDIDAETEEKLMKRKLLEQYTILKAAHHGSGNSSCAEFLETVSPAYTIISCGEGNFYGHPHRETVDRLKKTGSMILQTMDAGQITVFESGKEWGIRFPCKEEA